MLWPYQCLRQIAGKILPPPIKMIYTSMPDRIFQGVPTTSDQNFEIPSMASAMVISGFEADCGENITHSNQDDLYIILHHIFKGVLTI